VLTARREQRGERLVAQRRAGGGHRGGVQLLPVDGIAEPDAEPLPERVGRAEQPGGALVAARPGGQPAEQLEPVGRPGDLGQVVLAQQQERQHPGAVGFPARHRQVGERP
jgi:hypothetical protein